MSPSPINEHIVTVCTSVILQKASDFVSCAFWRARDQCLLAVGRISDRVRGTNNLYIFLETVYMHWSHEHERHRFMPDRILPSIRTYGAPLAKQLAKRRLTLIRKTRFTFSLAPLCFALLLVRIVLLVALSTLC